MQEAADRKVYGREQRRRKRAAVVVAPREAWQDVKNLLVWQQCAEKRAEVALPRTDKDDVALMRPAVIDTAWYRARGSVPKR
jgi:hypothetical protein